MRDADIIAERTWASIVDGPSARAIRLAREHKLLADHDKTIP